MAVSHVSGHRYGLWLVTRSECSGFVWLILHVRTCQTPRLRDTKKTKNPRDYSAVMKPQHEITNQRKHIMRSYTEGNPIELILLLLFFLHFLPQRTDCWKSLWGSWSCQMVVPLRSHCKLYCSDERAWLSALWNAQVSLKDTFRFLIIGAELSQCWEQHCANRATIVRAALRQPCHQRDPGSIPASTLFGMEFDVSLLCRERYLSTYSGFPLSQKTQNLIWFVVS